MNSDHLKYLVDMLRMISVNPRKYSGELADVVFELISADSLIAGVAEALLSGNSLKMEHKTVLSKRLLLGSQWALSDGSLIDLSEQAELLEYGSLIQRISDECSRLVRSL